MKKRQRNEAPKNPHPQKNLRERLWEARLPLAACGLAMVVYSRSLFCGFVRDDLPQIVQNPQVQSWEHLARLWASPLWTQLGPGSNMLFYRPLFSTWMLTVDTFGGLSPWFWHLSSILLHVAATYLVFRLCRRITGSEIGAGVAAIIFAVHPIHVDAVTWVSASCEVLFTLFALGAILMLLGSGGAEARPRVFVSAALFCAGLFAKETGIAILVILVVIAWVGLKGQIEGGRIKRLWSASWPYLAAAALYLLARWSVMHRVGVETGEHTWAEVIFSSPSILLFYLKKLVMPLGLSGCYVNPITASPTTIFWLEMAAILAGVALTGWFAFQHSPVLGLAAALVVLPLLPAVAVVRIYPQGDMIHDRYLYLSSVGLCLVIALLIRRIWSMREFGKSALIAATVAVVAPFSVLTFAQQKYYQDDLAFYSRVTEISPSDGLAYCFVGNIYLDDGRTDAALESFRKAHEVAPDEPKVTLFVARGLYAAGKNQEAEAVLQQVLKNPRLDSKRRNAARLSLANIEISGGSLEEGRQLLEQVDESDPTFPELHWARGVLFERQGQLAQAQAEYQKEFQITGDETARNKSESLERSIRSQPQ
jgi:Tfp pilus assembly protein PilF